MLSTNLLRSVAAAAVFMAVASAGPYDQYILAPASRTIKPASVYHVNGTVQGAASLTGASRSSSSAIFHGLSNVTYDFGINIAGVVSVRVNRVADKNAVLGVTFTESSVWINGQACDATADSGLDTPLFLPVGQGPGTYSVDKKFQRGAFRYLSLVSNSTSVEVTDLSIEYTAAPTQNLRSYTGYFHSNDELINRIWYAGAYTCQICTIDPKYGDALVHLGSISSTSGISLPNTTTWWSNSTIANGTSCLTDGAKRDREIWPGDLVISIPTTFVSTNAMDTAVNSLNALLVEQTADGMLPYSQTFAKFGVISFTYHLHSLNAIYAYYIFTGNTPYLKSIWWRFTKAVAWSLSYVDDSGLMNVTSSADWLRAGMGGHNIEANAILYYTLNKGIELAAVVGDKASITTWSTAASKIKVAANKLLWDTNANLYIDNETTTLHPQDGASWAIKSNLTESSEQNEAISAALQARWGEYGAPAPEAGSPLTISPFVGSVELEGHFLAGQPTVALELIRREWGFMLDDPRMTNSTFIEGYSADGSLHYAPYTNDPRVSYAHGWSTGPTSLLPFYVAGIHLLSAAGKTWTISPQLGDLTEVQAGFVTPLGSFAVDAEGRNGAVTKLSFNTPPGTTGSVQLSGGRGYLVQVGTNKRIALQQGAAANVPGGNWALQFE